MGIKIEELDRLLTEHGASIQVIKDLKPGDNILITILSHQHTSECLDTLREYFKTNLPQVGCLLSTIPLDLQVIRVEGEKV